MKNIIVNKILDLRQDVCPYSFIKTKLALEDMEPNQIIKILVAGVSIENIPRSIKEEGHSIIAVDKEDDFFVFYIKKLE